MNTNTCIKNLLKFICVLQNNSTDISCITNNCTKPFLGPSISSECYNTRIITLYNKNGELFRSNFIDNDTISYSSYFRIQEVDDDCCTLLILQENNNEFVSTQQTITVKIGCICAVKCIEDVSINL